MNEVRVSVESAPTAHADATRLLSERLTLWSVGERARYIVELALEEILTNIARYAYADTGTGPIDIYLERRPHSLFLAFEDLGPAFDPMQRDASPAGGRLETATIGGRGILMLRNLTQSMRYERCDGRNRLELVISDEPGDPQVPPPGPTG